MEKVYVCNIEDCEYKCKKKSNLNRHKADVHDIGVTWHKCDIEDCDYKCKQKSHLKQHQADVHNIDVKWHKYDIEYIDIIKMILKKFKI